MNSQEQCNIDQTSSPGGHRFRDFSNISRQILHFANIGASRSLFLQEISRLLMDFSTCEVIEVMANDDGLYYHWIASREPDETFRFEIIPKEEFITSHQEAVKYQCALDTAPQREASGKLYLSVLRIPFVIDENSNGILILKSCREGLFKKEEAEFYRGIAQTVGIGAANRRAQVKLRERIKELTCLYGIAQIIREPDTSPDDIFQQIVALLPPAMQYPEIASARIMLDGKAYISRGSNGEGEKLSSPVVINHAERGVIEVIYVPKQQELEISLFLREEQALLDAVASQIEFLVESRQAEQEKAELQQQLLHADRLATIGQLAAGVAHELNEPLANILGFTQLALKTPELPDQAKEDMNKVVTASLHAREIIKKLLIFARQMPSTKVSIDVNKVVEDSLSFFEGRLKKQNISLVAGLDPHVPSMIADPSQINQVLVNLIVNAIQAMPEGGTLTVRTGFDGEAITIDVEDTGAGMTDDVLRKIFVPFFTTKDVGQGTGLGLPVVHGIVSSHGGTISVESAPGEGSRFHIRFPLPVDGNP